MTSCCYSAFVDGMRKRITEGGLKSGDLVGTEVELARREGISRDSMRRAVALLIHDGLVERIPGKGVFVRELHAVTRRIQVVVPNMRLDQCARIAQGVQDAARGRGVEVQVYDAHGGLEEDLAFVRRLPESGVSGAVIMGLAHVRFNEVLYFLKTAGFPFVLVDAPIPGIEVPMVNVDNYAGGFLAGQNLAAAGHRRVGFVGYLAAPTVAQRLNGLRDALAEAGVLLPRILVRELRVADPLGDWRPEIARQVTALLSLPEPPTALFFPSDEVAANAYPVIKELGLRIPRDVSVVGFDDNPLCRWLDPPLATVAQPSREVGYQAMELLLQYSRPNGNGGGKKTPPSIPEDRLLPTQWVPRASLGKSPAVAAGVSAPVKGGTHQKNSLCSAMNV